VRAAKALASRWPAGAARRNGLPASLAWRLSHLCVRKLTRKRGVGRRLLEETQRQASEAGKPLRLAAPAGHLEASALAARTHLPLDPL
jgi:GNAT superfamily N-acetyltransferase